MLLKHVDHHCVRHLNEHVLDVKFDDHVPGMCLQMHADKMNQDIQATIRVKRGFSGPPSVLAPSCCGS